MRILGIESSCDETGAAVVEVERGDARFGGLGSAVVLSDVVQSQVALHAEYGGVVPELASRDHAKNVGHVVRDALHRAQVTLTQIDGVAVTHRPGLVGALLVGVQVAKGLAWGSELPFVGVDHLLGHLLAVYLRRAGEEPPSPPPFPFCALLASGGHTAIYRVDGPSAAACTELGATRDDAAGEAFDKVGKLLGLGYPGGPRIDRLAATGDASKIPWVAPMASGSSFEFSFSGLKTKLAQHVAHHGVPTGEALADVCASFQAAVTSVLASKLVRAAESEGVSHVVLGGGVAANRELRARVQELAAARGMRAHIPSLASCTDNAAMIALAGATRLLAGERDGWGLVVTSQTSLPRRTRKGGGPRAESR